MESKPRIDRAAVLAIVAEQSRNHGKAAELWKGTPDKVAYHTGAVHVCLEIQDRIERDGDDAPSSGWDSYKPTKKAAKAKR